MANYKVVEQFGRAPRLELAFMKDGKVYAYLLPADPHQQECFDAMKEIKQIFNLGLKVRAKKGKRK